MRWTGNGVADGTAVTSGNRNTAGNGDGVTFASTGTFTATYEGDGVRVIGDTTAIARHDTNAYAAGVRQSACQMYLTADVRPTSGVEAPIGTRNGTGNVCRLLWNTDGTMLLYNASASIASTPAIPVGSELLIDLIGITDATAPTTTNGRVIARIKNLNNPTWNTTGDWFFDTLYTTNTGTSDHNHHRFMKTSVGAAYLSPGVLFENMGWGTVAVNPAHTSRAQAESYFMTLAAAPVANAGTDIASTEPYVPFTLDGSASTGDNATYLWELISTNVGSVSITNPTSLVTAVTVTPVTVQDEQFTFRLTVTNAGGTSQDTVTVTVLRAAWFTNLGGVDRPLRIFRETFEPIHQQGFETLTVGSAISNTDLRTALGDPTMSGNTTQRGLTAVNDIGAPRGKVITTTLPGPYYTGSEGVVFLAALQTPTDYASIEYDLRFRSGFEWSGGGKLPGLGGKNANIAGAPPTGGTPSPHGWSSRFMWLKDSFGGNLASNDELVAYLYAPWQQAGSYGVNRHTNTALGGNGTTSNGTWHKVKQVYKMNTSNVSDSSTPANTLVQGTHYLADGLHQIWVDGVKVYEKTDEVFRFYSDVRITHLLWEIFRGGGDSGWSASGSGEIDIDNLVIERLG